MRARTASDFLRITWSVFLSPQRRDPHLRFLQAKRQISIHAHRPLPLQADGDLIGQTPVHIEVVPGAVDLIVPVRASPPGWTALRDDYGETDE